MKRGSDSKDEDDTKDETNTEAKSQKITIDQITRYMEGNQSFDIDVSSKLKQNKMTADIRGELLQLRLTMTGLPRRERYGWLRQLKAKEFWKENCPLDRKNELVSTDKIIFIDAICGNNEDGDGSLSKPLSTIKPLMLDSFWVTRQRRCMCISRESHDGGVQYDCCAVIQIYASCFRAMFEIVLVPVAENIRMVMVSGTVMRTLTS